MHCTGTNIVHCTCVDSPAPGNHARLQSYLAMSQFTTALWLFVCLTLTKEDVNNRYQDQAIGLFATNGTDGIEVRVVSSSQDTTLDFPGQYLPPECGENSLRCENLSSFVVSGEGVTEQLQYAVFVPTIRAVLIIILQYDHMSSRLEISDNYTLDVRTRCSPVVFFGISGRLYTTCMNLDGFLTVFEFYLNTSFIQSSNFSRPLIENLNPPGLSPISNFIYVDLGDEFHGRRHQILFLTGNYLQGFDPTVFNLVTGVNISNCPPTSEIKYAGSQTLLVYCNDSVVYIDLVHQAVHRRLSYDDGGYPYLCPRDDAKFLYFSNISCLSFRRNQAGPGMDCINVSSIRTGRCFGTDSSIFVYSDAMSGAVNAIVIAADGNTTRRRLSLESYGVARVFNDRYVVFSEDSENATIVVDSQTNFSTIFEARNLLRPDLVMIVSVLTPRPNSTSLPTPEPTSRTTVQPTSSPGVPQKKGIAGPVAGSVVGIVISILLILAIIVIAKRWKCTKMNTRTQGDEQPLVPYPSQEAAQAHGQSAIVPSVGGDLVASENAQQPADSEHQPTYEESVHPLQAIYQGGRPQNDSILVYGQ